MEGIDDASASDVKKANLKTLDIFWHRPAKQSQFDLHLSACLIISVLNSIPSIHFREAISSQHFLPDISFQTFPSRQNLNHSC
jgi:hypothetical protein